MTAKTKHGHKAHRPAHGADPGTPHERLNRLHAQVGRPEGAMHGGAPMPPSMPDAAPPMMGAPPAMSPPGAGPSTDSDEGEMT